MRGALVLLLCLGIVGCATTTQLGNKVTGTQSYVFSTASKDITYEAALSAMKNLKYKISNTDKEAGMISGYYSLILGSNPTRLNVNLAEVDGKTKVIAVVKQEGAIDSWDFTGYYSRYQDNFYNKLKQELIAKGYGITK